MFEEFFKEKFSYKFIFILLSILPLAIVTSSLLTNSIVILVTLIFLKIIIINKEFRIHDNFFFILIFLFFIFLILNLKNSVDIENSLNRTFGFLRFLLLAFSISYILSFKNYRYINLILYSWLFIFFFVSFDLLFEYIFGHNLFGYSNQFPGRLSGLLNDELKIGEYYFGFIAIAIATIFIGYENLALLYLFSGLIGVIHGSIWLYLYKKLLYPFAPSLSIAFFLCLIISYLFDKLRYEGSFLDVLTNNLLKI